MLRGVIIGALLVAYGWFVHLPEDSFTQMFVLGAVVQLLIIVIRRFVPPGLQPQAQSIFENVADGVTVFAFAAGVFGGIWRFTQSV